MEFVRNTRVLDDAEGIMLEVSLKKSNKLVVKQLVSALSSSEERDSVYLEMERALEKYIKKSLLFKNLRD